jgi:hypothetical protein
MHGNNVLSPENIDQTDSIEERINTLQEYEDSFKNSPSFDPTNIQDISKIEDICKSIYIGSIPFEENGDSIPSTFKKLQIHQGLIQSAIPYIFEILLDISKINLRELAMGYKITNVDSLIHSTKNIV